MKVQAQKNSLLTHARTLKVTSPSQKQASPLIRKRSLVSSPRLTHSQTSLNFRITTPPIHKQSPSQPQQAFRKSPQVASTPNLMVPSCPKLPNQKLTSLTSQKSTQKLNIRKITPRTPKQAPRTPKEHIQTPQKTFSQAVSSSPYVVTSENLLKGSSATVTVGSLPTQATMTDLNQQEGLQEFLTRIQSTALCNEEAIYQQHLEQTYNALRLVKNIRQPSKAQLKSQKLRIPERAAQFKKTVVFDLDETLVHCTDEPSPYTAAVLPILMPNGKVENAYLNVRPFAQDALRELHKYYEIIVFTASHECYANMVLDLLDPKHELIDYRLFRDDCMLIDGIYIKDLRILPRPLSSVLLVDNAAYSFAYQLHNGIPITSWYQNQEDSELKSLVEYLIKLRKVKDVRKVNRQMFRLDTYCEDYEEQLKNSDIIKIHDQS